jgi:hypothetical protein
MADLGRIAEWSRPPVLKLRDVLDHGLLPGGGVARRGRGAARSFTPLEAFDIVTVGQTITSRCPRVVEGLPPPDGV